MGWKQERDLLIAQTLAFVQSMTGKTEDAARSALAQRHAAPDVETGPADPVQIRAAEIIHAPAAPPREIQVEVPMPRAVVSHDIRSEMQARVASFRAHQQRFDREREEYCAATLVKLRTAIGHPASDLLSRQRPTADPAPRSFQAPATGGS
jgi:hypothetical protein